MYKIIFIGITIIIMIIYYFKTGINEYFQNDDDMNYLNNKKNEKKEEFDNAINTIIQNPNANIDNIFSAVGVIYIVKKLISNDPDLFKSTERLLSILNMIISDNETPITEKSQVLVNIMEEINIIFKDKKDMIYDIYDKYYLIILDESKLIIEQYDIDPKYLNLLYDMVFKFDESGEDDATLSKIKKNIKDLFNNLYDDLLDNNIIELSEDENKINIIDGKQMDFITKYFSKYITYNIIDIIYKDFFETEKTDKIALQRLMTSAKSAILNSLRPIKEQYNIDDSKIIVSNIEDTNVFFDEHKQYIKNTYNTSYMLKYNSRSKILIKEKCIFKGNGGSWMCPSTGEFIPCSYLCDGEGYLEHPGDWKEGESTYCDEDPVFCAADGLWHSGKDISEFDWNTRLKELEEPIPTTATPTTAAPTTAAPTTAAPTKSCEEELGYKCLNGSTCRFVRENCSNPNSPLSNPVCDCNTEMPNSNATCFWGPRCEFKVDNCNSDTKSCNLIKKVNIGKDPAPFVCSVDEWPKRLCINEEEKIAILNASTPTTTANLSNNNTQFKPQIIPSIMQRPN
jgi:hypothetical protein